MLILILILILILMLNTNSNANANNNLEYLCALLNTTRMREGPTHERKGTGRGGEGRESQKEG